MNAKCLNCPKENTRDYPVCETCEPTCHFTNRPQYRDCRCDQCGEKRANEYPALNLMAWEGEWTDRETLAEAAWEEEGRITYGWAFPAAA